MKSLFLLQRRLFVASKCFYKANPTTLQHICSSRGSLRTLFATPRTLWLPVKTVEVVSLPRTKANARVVQRPVMALGSTVQVGDVVAVLVDGDEEQCEIVAPFSGQLMAYVAPTDQPVSIGDALFTIDTDAEPTAEGDRNDVASVIAQHVKENQGRLEDEFLNSMLFSDDNIDRLRNVAVQLRDRFPAHRSKALRFFERILMLQKEGMADATATCSPLEVAATYTDIGIVLTALGDLEAASTHLQQAVYFRREALGDDPELVGSLVHLGSIKIRTGDLDGAFADFAAALEIQKKQLGPEHRLVAASTNNLGAIKYQQGLYQEALVYYRQALQIFETLNGADDNNGSHEVDIAGSHQNIGVALKHAGDSYGALDHARKALKMRQSVLGSDHPDTATSHYCLAQMLSEAGEMEGAMEQYQAALAIQEKHYGKHPITASTLVNMGAVYYQHHKYDEAQAKYRQGLDMLEATVGPAHPDVAAAYNNMGLALYQKGEYDEALTQHHKAYQIMSKQLQSEEHPSLAASIGSIGNVLKMQKKLDEALVQYRRAHVMLETALGDSHPDVGSSYNNMGQVLAGQGKFEDSLTVYRAAQKIFREALGAQHPHTGSCHFNSGLVLREMNDFAAAAAEFQKARNIWASNFGPEHPHISAADRYIAEMENS